MRVDTARETQTRLFSEAAEAPAAVAAQLEVNRRRLSELGAALRARKLRAVATCARGSSDHVATFAKYLIEKKLGLLTSSASPSINSLYSAAVKLQDTLFVVISQSGQSPDLLAAAEAAKAAGAFVVALVNVEDSPLAKKADAILPLCAGVELGVAATKSYIAAAAAVIDLVVHWAQDEELQAKLRELPELLKRAWALDWSPAATRLKPASDLYTIGRGLGLGAAQEAALKLKETCGLHAESFSAAEVLHGPIALVQAGFPVLIFSQDDETRVSISELADMLAGLGAEVMVAGFTHPRAISLPALDAHPVLQPLLLVQSFYRMTNALALARGYDPDRPRHLNKVTETM